MFRLVILSVLLAFGVSLERHAGAQEIERPTLADFLAGSSFWSPELSPSGNYVAAVRKVDDKTYLMVANLDGKELSRSHIPIGEFYLNWIEWATDKRMVVSVTGFIDLRNGKLLSLDDLDKDRVVPYPFTRLIATNRDGTDQAVMFAENRQMNKNFYLGGVVDFLDSDPDHILMAARKGGDLDLFKVNIINGSFERVAIGTNRTFRWFVDREGEPAFRFDSNRRGTIIRIFAREDRENGKIKWRKTKTIRFKRERETSAKEFEPLYVGPTETTYYVAARPEGENTTGIYLYDFEKDEYVETLKSNPEIDIEDAFFNRSTREIQGYIYYDDKLEIEFLDNDIQKHLDGLDVYFGGDMNIVPMQSSEDGKRWLVWASSPLDPGSYHIYDLDTNVARQIANRRNSLFGKQLSNMQTIEFAARDGLKLRGYLTRPSGIAEGSKPPLIMLPHGGPEARDVFGYNKEVQILAAKGYQVFQPNFRGSSGFGKSFADKGRRQWGRAMQTDIDDAYAYLISQGYVDSGNACIYGSSYGGYAALAAATLTPDQYRCAISVAGISDLEKQLKFDRKEAGSDSDEYKYWKEHIGDPKKDKAELRAVSPAKLVDRVEIPILLIHGENDGVVPAKQSEIMEKALRTANKSVRYVVLEESGHSYRAEGQEEREYEEILSFLSTHLPVSK